MPAQPADIAAGTRRATIVTWSDAAIQTRYPNARDGSESPAEGFFDSAADAATVLAARAALIGAERDRYAVTAQALLWPDPTTGLPTIGLTDDEHNVDRLFLPSRIEVDLEEEVTRYGLYG